MNAIAALGLKTKDLYLLPLKEFIEQNPEIKKQRKEIQTQRYELYNQERLANIERCKSKRNEIIAHSKKVKPKIKEEELDNEENMDDYNYNKYRIRNSDDNYIIRKVYSGKKRENEIFETNKNKILVTDVSYVMRDSKGRKAEIKKDEIDSYQCIKDERKKLLEKSQKKDEQLMRYLKAELEREKKIKEFKKKQEKNEKNMKKFNKLKNKEIKLIENDRYKDNQNIYERQKLIQKYFSQNDLENNSKNMNQSYNNLNKSPGKNNENPENNKDKKNLLKDKSQSKMETLKKQIQDYEKKSEEYKQKIANMFELKDENEIKELIKKTNLPEDKSKKLKSTELMKQKMNRLGERFEIEKYRRENAIIKSMDNFQNKINRIMLYNENKEERRKKAMLKQEKEREMKIDKRNQVLDRIKENKIKNEKNNEIKRKKLIEDIEKNELKNYAIKEERKKILEERRKMNKLNEEEREEMKMKIHNIINNEKNFKEDEKSEDIIKKMIGEKVE